ncbi:MAG: hypothetical protein ONB05_05475, partial [candidate division KSB1 bacterium]|nr:hypothetical protein [candidate division KSB1 bacterium]
MRYLYLSFLWLHLSVYGILALEGDQDIKNVSLDSLLNIQVSTATKYEQKIREAPASVTIITSEEIERYGYRTVDEVLMSV